MSKIKKLYDDLRETITTLEVLESRVDQIMNGSDFTGIDHIRALECEKQDFFDSAYSLQHSVDVFLGHTKPTIKVLELDNLVEFLSLKMGILTQIRVSKSFADELEIGQYIKIIPHEETGEQSIKVKVKQIYNSQFLKTDSGISESIVHFDFER